MRIASSVAAVSTKALPSMGLGASGLSVRAVNTHPTPQNAITSPVARRRLSRSSGTTKDEIRLVVMG